MLIFLVIYYFFYFISDQWRIDVSIHKNMHMAFIYFFVNLRYVGKVLFSKNEYAINVEHVKGSSRKPKLCVTSGHPQAY